MSRADSAIRTTPVHADQREPPLQFRGVLDRGDALAGDQRDRVVQHGGDRGGAAAGGSRTDSVRPVTPSSVVTSTRSSGASRTVAALVPSA